MRRREPRITIKDAAVLCGFILHKTGYSEEKVFRILEDYGNEILEHGPNLPTRIMAKLRGKWGLGADVGRAAFMWAAGIVGAMRVRVIRHEGTRQYEILAE